MLIQEMRNRSHGIVAKIIVAMIFVVFALFGFGSITTFLVPVPKVASVNGEGITEQEMLIAIERTRSAMLASGETKPADIDEDALRQQVLDDLIERRLLTQFVDEKGFFISDARLDQDMINTPSFQVDGRFNSDRFQLLLRSAGYTPLGYRQLIREENKYQQVNYGIAASEFVTPLEIDRIAELSRQIRDIAYLTIEVENLKKDVVLEEGAASRYYQEHVNDFITEEMVNLSYVEISKEELAGEIEVDEAELRAFYEQERDAYRKPEERKAAHILIEINDSVTEAQAREKIDAIQTRIKNGEDFATLAKEVSEDPGSAQNGGELGFSGRGAFVEPFEKALFSLEPNQVSEPVLTEFGYHLIKLEAVQQEVVPSYEELAEKLEKDYRSMQVEELFVARSSKLSELAYETPDLQRVAADLNLAVKETGFVGQNTGTAGGIAANKQVLDLAFSPDLLIDGHNSDLIEIDADHHVVIKVKEHKPAKVREFNEVATEVEGILRDNLAREKASDEMNAALQLLKEGSITRYVADQLGVEWQVEEAVSRQSREIDPEILNLAFRLPRPAQGEKALGTLILANGDAVIVSVTNVTTDESRKVSDMELNGLSRFMESNKGNVTFNEFRQGLRAKGSIEREN